MSQNENTWDQPVEHAFGWPVFLFCSRQKKKKGKCRVCLWNCCLFWSNKSVGQDDANYLLLIFKIQFPYSVYEHCKQQRRGPVMTMIETPGRCCKILEFFQGQFFTAIISVKTKFNISNRGWTWYHFDRPIIFHHLPPIGI